MDIIIVTQTFPPRFGGMEAVMYSLANRFSSEGTNTTVFADQTASFPSDNFKFYSCKAPKLFRSFIKKHKINRLIKNSDSIVICDSWKSIRSVPDRFRKIVVLAHGQEYLNEKKHREISTLLDRSYKIVCSSKATEDLVVSVNNKVKNKTKVIYPTYMLKREVATTHHKANDSALRLLSLCRLDKRKGLYNTAIALSKLKEKGFDFFWDIAGSGPEELELKSLVSDLGLNNHTKFYGSVSADKKENLYRSADLYIMPSYTIGRSMEGFGITYIEAASHGIPSISGESGGAREAVIDQETGWCVSGDKPQSIEEALLKIFTNKDLLINYGLNAAHRYDNELSGTKTFNQLKEFITVI